ncbi:hypothetical protein [Nonomuraea sp. K271]|uniref:hypothetical protein n=1 Tax=Nonomuraea sp. K271 TaxID=1848319 RepID=UPI00137706D1|nr:hypothetical protein [Nonomuraea sp. K271]NBE97208.1 hypothetical protein [Nonomuraea sp. K271]
MSEVVPLPSFGEVFFDARGQERCLRVTWHEGTLVLSLWRGEMCTASFRMPMEDVGRLLDTLDDGYAEATGEQPAVPAQEPGTETIPGTGQYHRPPQHAQQPPQQPQPDDRPTAALSPNDVLVARGAPPAPQDKLVASYGGSAAPKDQRTSAYGDSAAQQHAPAYGERAPFTGPQYVDQTGPQQAYTGDPFSGPQYTADPMSGPHYVQPQAEPFTGPQYVDEPVYQLPGDQRPKAPVNTDPLGFPSQAADPYQPAQQHRPDPYPSDPYPSDPYGRRSDTYPQPQPSTAGLGTPMHGIPGAGRPRPAPQQRQAPARQNPVDPLMAMGRDDHGDPEMTRPYVGDPMFSTGERLRPEQPDYHERSDRREW